MATFHIAQFNPSTLKAIYNVNTEKHQTTEITTGCPWYKLYMNISGILQCSDLECGWPTSLPSKVDLGTPEEAENGCYYLTEISGIHYRARWHKNDNNFYEIAILYADAECPDDVFLIFDDPRSGTEGGYQLNDVIPNLLTISDCGGEHPSQGWFGHIMAGYSGTIILTTS